jgi:hypothetical protein
MAEDSNKALAKAYDIGGKVAITVFIFMLSNRMAWIFHAIFWHVYVKIQHGFTYVIQF